MIEDTNTNGTGESVTLTEAAAQLSIPLQRLQRLLTRPEFAPYVSKGERPTKTGIRTVTLVSVSVLSAIRTEISEHKQEQNGEKRYRSEGSQDLAPLYQRLLEEKDARIRALEAQVEDLKKTKDAALDLAARGQALQAIEGTRHAPESPADAAQETGPQNQPAEAPEAPQRAPETPTAGGPDVPPLLSPTGYSGPDTMRVPSAGAARRSWWLRLFGRGEG